MRVIAYIGMAMIISGISLMIFSEPQVGIVLIFPFIVASGPYGFLGGMLVFGGIFLIFIGILALASPENPPLDGIVEKPLKRGFGIILVGPIPLIIDTKHRYLSLISLLIFIIGLILLFYLIIFP